MEYMIYSVIIEELTSQEFKINANSMKEAMDIAEEKYNKGEYVLAPGILVAKRMQVENDDYIESTEWTEF